MANPVFGLVTGEETHEELIYIVGNLQEQLQFMMNHNLNSKNIKEIGNWVVGPDYFQSRDGIVGISSAGTADSSIRFWAGASDPTAAPWYVTQGGHMHGADIDLSTGSSYPKVTMSTTDTFIGVYLDAADYIVVNPGISPFVTRPTIEFVSSDTDSRIGNNDFFVPSFEINSNKIIGISSDQSISLSASLGSIGATSSAGTISDIVTSILSKVTSGSSTSSVTIGDHNHGIVDGTQLLDADGVTVHTFVASGGFTHSHTV